jgi:hypothetical protein
MNSSKVYEKLIDEKNKSLLIIEEENNKLKSERINLEKFIREEYQQKFRQVQDSFNTQIQNLTEELDNYKEKYLKNKNKKKHFQEEDDRLKKENDSLNIAIYENITNYEKMLQVLKDEHSKEVTELKKREEEFMKSNEDLAESDIYTVYKDIKTKFHDKLKECIDYKEENNKIGKYINNFYIADENKIIKLSLDNSDNILKECAKIQVNQQKILNQIKQQLEEKTKQLEKVNKIFLIF